MGVRRPFAEPDREMEFPHFDVATSEVRSVDQHFNVDRAENEIARAAACRIVVRRRRFFAT